MQDWTSSPTIHTGDAWNTLRVTANGSSMDFFINNTNVWSGVDATYPMGKVGLTMFRSATSTGDYFWADWATLTTLSSTNNTVEETSSFQKLTAGDDTGYHP